MSGRANRTDNPSPVSPLWMLADELRGREQLTATRLISAAVERGIPVTEADLSEAIARFDGPRGNWGTPPDHLVNFISVFLSGRQAKRVLDPSAGAGILLSAIVRRTNAVRGLGITRNNHELTMARAISEGLPIEWQAGDLLSTDIEVAGTFDAVVSIPPIGSQRRTETLQINDRQVSVRGEEGHLIILHAAQRLAEDGSALFITSDRFFWDNNQGQLLFNQFGLHVNAVIALQAGAFAPVTSIPLSLIVISRHPSDHLFVAELDRKTDPSVIIDNLQKQRDGRLIEQGRLIPHVEFRSWPNLKLNERIRYLARRSGLTPHPLSELVNAMKLGDRTSSGGFEVRPNAVYLPLIGPSPAVIRFEDLRLKSQNYVQLEVNPEIASAEYVAKFLGTELGHLVRERYTSGGYIPKLSKSSIQDMPIFLPMLDIQNEVVAVDRQIAELQVQLESIGRQLWETPRGVNKLARELNSLNQRDRFGVWIESLPFPLASILERYRAGSETRDKHDHLLHFFEAAAQFSSCVMLSAFRSNPDFYESRRSQWADTDPGRANAWSRSSFGDWVRLAARLAVLTRKMLSDADERSLCLQLFGAANDELPSALSRTEFISALDSASNLRNRFAHSGVLSDTERTSQLLSLENELTRVHSAWSYAFESFLLVQPGSGEQAGHIYKQTVKKYMGSNSIFHEDVIDLSTPLDTKRTYLLDQQTPAPVELVPLFRIMESPRTASNACYFYNRIDRDSVEWVSYHFDQDASVNRADPELVQVLSELYFPPQPTRGQSDA